jgi:tetratricopeptide (TPR) repeat protein
MVTHMGRYGTKMRAAWLGLALAVLAAPGGVAAQGASDEAREQFLQGVQMADDQRWAEAVQHFRQSRALLERDSTVFNLAVALFRLGKYGEAVAAFEDFLEMSEGDAAAAKARAEAQSFMRRAKSSMARVVLEVSPADATVAVDGEPMEGQGTRRELSLDPGSRRLRIEAPNHLAQTLKLSLLSGSEATTRVELVPLMGDLDRQAQREESARRAAAAEAAADGRGGVTYAADGSPMDDGSRRPLIKNPWFWVAAGAVLVAAGVGLGVGLSGGGGGSDPYGGTTGIVIRP